MSLITGLAVAFLVFAFAAPALERIAYARRVVTGADSLLAALHLARTEAAKRLVPTVLCASEDGQHCLGRPAWQRGWLLCADEDRDGDCAADEPAILRRGPLPDGFQTWSGSRDRVVYRPDGTLAGGTNLSVLFCPPHPDMVRQVRVVAVSLAGRARQDRLPATACPS